MRGSDPDAALYWLTRMLQGGEDPRYLARGWCGWRSRISASPTRRRWCLARARPRPTSSWARPRASWRWSQATLYLALAPKSNAAYLAYGTAQRSAQEHGPLPPPMHIRNAPTG